MFVIFALISPIQSLSLDAALKQFKMKCFIPVATKQKFQLPWDKQRLKVGHSIALIISISYAHMSHNLSLTYSPARLPHLSPRTLLLRVTANPPKPIASSPRALSRPPASPFSPHSTPPSHRQPPETHRIVSARPIPPACLTFLPALYSSVAPPTPRNPSHRLRAPYPDR